MGSHSSSLSQQIIDLTDDSDHGNTVTYPTIKELLGELDEAMPSSGFARYEERLSNAGFSHVHRVTDTPNVRQNFDRLEIPIEIRQEIFERATRMTRRTEKSKQTAKTEEDPPI